MPIFSANSDGKHIFSKYDRNGDGRIDKEELKKEFKNLGARFPAWRAYRAFKHADVNGDGVITLDEINLLIEYILRSGYIISR